MPEARKGLYMIIPLIAMDWDTRLQTVVTGFSVLLAQESSLI